MTRLSAIRGDDFIVSVVWREPRNEDGTPGDPIDLTGYDVVLTIKIDGETTEYTEGDGLTITDDEGKIDVLIEEDITTDWGSEGTYRIRVTAPDDTVTTILRGRLAVS